ncbi:MAG TPA: helix-turn-helix domain-containing protein [Roseiflexaceae bacterium]|nr:helix-turn-helix domain-containing protein [Roseiflexaceae bacterium]
MTTTQRDLLHLLLTTEIPLGASTIGRQLRLTPRQVHYSLREIKAWVGGRNATVRHTPGIGVQIVCTVDQKRRMLGELSTQSKFQLILTPGQRQQLLALQLLLAREPLTLSDLQQDVVIARATVLKDLDIVEPWLMSFGLQIVRRQHRGCWIDGAELAQRQALAALLWGDVPFDRPILRAQHGQGLIFALAQDGALLPIIGRIDLLLRDWDTQAALERLAWAETELGGRFTDDAILHLMLALVIQGQRVRMGRYFACDASTLQWLQSQAVWPIAAAIGGQLWSGLPDHTLAAETAALAIHLMSGARDEAWRHDLGMDSAFPRLIDTLLVRVADAYGVPGLGHDRLLREGLEAHFLPACMRQRFGLWTPPRPSVDTQADRYAVERAVARQLVDHVTADTGIALPADTYDELVLLLRAAFIRARPERARRVLVVCPSGMATTQLLVARLRARFPRMGSFEVLSTRDLSAERIASADLIITTIPLALSAMPSIDIIQVHPMLKPEDVAALTQWMA